MRTKGGSRSVHDRSSKRLFYLVQYLVDDFVCALRRRVLYQGRIYVFEHHACFISRIFNLEKILVIPLKVINDPDSNCMVFLVCDVHRLGMKCPDVCVCQGCHFYSEEEDVWLPKFR